MPDDPSPSDSPTGAPTLREALAELVALQDRSPGAIWPGVWERARAALSAQAPPAPELAEAEETIAQLVRALREAVEGPTFMDGADIERHTLHAKDCPPDSKVMLVSAIKRFAAGYKSKRAGTPQAAIGAQADTHANIGKRAYPEAWCATMAAKEVEAGHPDMTIGADRPNCPTCKGTGEAPLMRGVGPCPTCGGSGEAETQSSHPAQAVAIENAPVEPLPLTDDELRQHITDERARNKAQMRIDSGRAGSPDPSLPPPKETQ